MQYRKYIIKFTNGKTVFVRALGTEDAIILAQAAMIKNGWTHCVSEVLQVYDSEMKECADLIA